MGGVNLLPSHPDKDLIIGVNISTVYKNSCKDHIWYISIIESCIGNEAANDESITGAKTYLVLNTLILVLLNFYSLFCF